MWTCWGVGNCIYNSAPKQIVRGGIFGHYGVCALLEQCLLRTSQNQATQLRVHENSCVFVALGIHLLKLQSLLSVAYFSEQFWSEGREE